MVEGSEQREAKERKARRKRVAIALVAVALLIPIAALNIVNRIETDVPSPLWTTAAFPTPSEDDNGFPLIAHYHSTTISGIDLQPIDNLLAASRDNRLPELGRVFSPARVVASKIREHTALCTQAFDKKRMVIPCLAVEEGACTTEALQICTRLVTFAALDEAARGAPTGVRKMAGVLRQLNDVAANSPHPWVQARGLVLLRAAIHHAAAVIKWRRVNAQPLRDAIAHISEESLPPMNIVIASYLLKHLALRQALDQADTWLLDEGSVIRGLNEPFETARDGGQLPPPIDFQADLFWWFNNPVGKKMLATVRPGADDDYKRTAALRDTVLKRREEALRLK